MSISVSVPKGPFPAISVVIDESSYPPWKRSQAGNDLFLVVLKGYEYSTAVSDDSGNSWIKVGPCLWTASCALATSRITLHYAGPAMEIEAAAYEFKRAADSAAEGQK